MKKFGRIVMIVILAVPATIIWCIVTAFGVGIVCLETMCETVGDIMDWLDKTLGL